MVRGKCALGRGLGPPPRKMLVCLNPSKSIHRCLLAGKGLLYAVILNCNWEKIWGRSSPPSRLNPVMHNIYCKQDILVERIFWLKGSLYCNHTVRRYVFG